MSYNIITNVGNQKKPWEDVPIEVLIEEERKRNAAPKEHRERLHAPPPLPPLYSELEVEDDDDYKIIIKL